ncbi:hypothetical protein AVEN_268601-1 [Araneus ventricosus]|uniref:DUF5641 domain-containing protein n=1 Tax=Araneus ventricosus TaxID=182803 RepID=A0A4Y2GYI8_ARAVE|nr:hypothetical protein AVEN_268601-1 [Araneus ventricosus]
MNIADLLSRGCTPQQMLNSKWWEGPSWLKENPVSWPVIDIVCQPNEVDIEKRKSKLVNMNLTEDTPLGRDGKIRTVNLKTQHGTVLRPIQRIYPLESYSNQSVDREPGGEESNSHDVSDNKNKLLPADDVIMRKYTSSGRYVKAPKRFDLLSNVCYVLETLKEGRML